MWSEGLWGFGFIFGFGSEHETVQTIFGSDEEWFEVNERGKGRKAKILCDYGLWLEIKRIHQVNN